MFTQDTITGFYHHAMGEETTRLQAVINQALEVDMQTFKTACKDAAASEEALKGRISELRQIYGACRFAELNITKGYHDTVAEARKTLKEKGITWDGTKPRTEEQKEADRLARDRKAAKKEAEENFDWSKPDSVALFADAIETAYAKQVSERKAKAEQEQMMKVNSAVAAIIATGEDYAVTLYLALEEALLAQGILQQSDPVAEEIKELLTGTHN